QTTRSRKTSERIVVEPHKGDRRYVGRSKTGQFRKEVNVGRFLSAPNLRRKAKTKVTNDQGNRGDAKRRGESPSPHAKADRCLGARTKRPQVGDCSRTINPVG